jgi:hypothetical protein
MVVILESWDWMKGWVEEVEMDWVMVIMHSDEKRRLSQYPRKKFVADSPANLPQTIDSAATIPNRDMRASPPASAHRR